MKSTPLIAITILTATASAQFIPPTADTAAVTMDVTTTPPTVSDDLVINGTWSFGINGGMDFTSDNHIYSNGMSNEHLAANPDAYSVTFDAPAWRDALGLDAFDEVDFFSVSADRIFATDEVDARVIEFDETDDTTLSRSAPGVLAVEGVDLLTSVAAADITDATADGISIITSNFEDLDSVQDFSPLDYAGSTGQPAHLRYVAKMWRKFSYMRQESVSVDSNGLIPPADEQQLIWLNVGDSIAARAFDMMAATLIRTYSADIPYYQNARLVTMVDDTSTYSGHISPVHMFARTDGGTINEKNSATADYASNYTGSTVDLDSGDTITFYGKPGQFTGPGAFDVPVLVPATTVKVFYERSRGAGTFDIEVSTSGTDSGFAKEGLTVDADNATTDIAVAERTLAAGNYAARITCQSGAVTILGWALYRDDVPQVVLYNTAVGSLSPLEWETPSSAQIEGLLAAIGPDFITWAYNDSAADNSTALDVLQPALANQSLDPTILLFSNVSTVAADTTVDQQYDMAVARDGIIAYSARFALGTDDEIIAAGLEGDGVHLDRVAYDAMSEQMMALLGLPARFATHYPQPDVSDDGQTITHNLGREESWDLDGEKILRISEIPYLKNVSPAIGRIVATSGLWLNEAASGNDIVEMDATPWNTTTDFSIVVSLDHNDTNSATNQAAILAWDSSAGGTTSFPTGATATSALWLYRDNVNSQWELGLNPGDSVTLGQIWRWSDTTDGPDFLVVTYNQSTGEAKLYLNGQLQTAVSDPAVSVDWSANALNAPVLGSDSNAHSVRELSAKFYAFGLSQNILSAEQAAALYANPALVSEYCEEVAYLFDERAGTRVYDHSGSGADADIENGGAWIIPARTSTTLGVGSAPSDTDSLTPTDWLEVYIDGASYRVPVYQ